MIIGTHRLTRGFHQGTPFDIGRFEPENILNLSDEYLIDLNSMNTFLDRYGEQDELDELKQFWPDPFAEEWFHQLRDNE